MELILTTLVSLFLVGLFWVLPIWLGLRAARRKNRSCHWMWFGFHPIGGWITFAVLASLSPLRVCPQCGEKSKSHAKICPYCMSNLSELSQPSEGQIVQVEISDSTGEKSLRTSILVARIVVSIICFVMPFLYLSVYSTAVLQGNISKFVIGFSKVPFKQAPIVVLLVISAFTFLAVNGMKYFFYTRTTLKPSSVIPLNIIFCIVASAFMETIGIYGLVIGFMYGPEVASLTLTMLLVTVLGGITIFPRNLDWRNMQTSSINQRAK